LLAREKTRNSLKQAHGGSLCDEQVVRHDLRKHYADLLLLRR
jgi:hypothetical protein